MKQPLHNIGDRVYHNTVDGQQGVVIDCTYSQRSDEWTCLVSFGFGGESMFAVKEELSKTKVIV